MTSSSASSSDFARRFVCSSLSVAVATAATNPIDVVKVNLQMHKTSSVNVPSVATATPIATASTSAAPIATAPLARPRPGPSSFGFIGTATHLFRNEGMWAFTKGKLHPVYTRIMLMYPADSVCVYVDKLAKSN